MLRAMAAGGGAREATAAVVDLTEVCVWCAYVCACVCECVRMRAHAMAAGGWQCMRGDCCCGGLYICGPRCGGCRGCAEGSWAVQLEYWAVTGQWNTRTHTYANVHSHTHKLTSPSSTHRHNHAHTHTHTHTHVYPYRSEQRGRGSPTSCSSLTHTWRSRRASWLRASPNKLMSSGVCVYVCECV